MFISMAELLGVYPTPIVPVKKLIRDFLCTGNWNWGGGFSRCLWFGLAPDDLFIGQS